MEWRDIKGYERIYQVSNLGRVKSLIGIEEKILKPWCRGKNKYYRCVGLCKNGIRIKYDIHRLVEGRDLVIGGIKITHEKGLLGHSDADVLVHAIIDAMLGALALDDIGTLFPDTDPKYKNIDSTILLKHVYEKIKVQGYRIANIDSNIIAQSPKMMPYIPKMKNVLAQILQIELDEISIKAKTKEKLDAVGENLAIESNAVVLLDKI